MADTTPTNPAPYVAPTAEIYDDSIDLHHYVNVLIKYWWIVLGVPFVALVIAGLLGFVVLPVTYDATALVTVTRPRYVIQLSPEFTTVPIDQNSIPFKAYPAIATSRDVVTLLLDDVSDQLPSEARSVRALGSMLSARNGSDPSLIELTVTSENPALSAAVANSWARLFSRRINEVYGEATMEVEGFAQELALATQRRLDAEAAMIEFQQRNPAAIIEAQINDRTEALVAYLSVESDADRAIQFAAALRERLAALPAGATSTYSDELTALLLQIGALTSIEDLTFQVQLPEQPVGTTAAEQRVLLDGLVSAMETLRDDVGAKVAELEPQIMSLQQQLEVALSEEAQLDEQRTLARSLERIISLKVEEASLSRNTNGGDVKIAAMAVAPDRPSGPRKVMLLGIAGALGLMAGVFLAYVVNFFANGRRQPQR